MRKHWEEVPTGESCTSRYRCSSVRIQLNTVSSLLPIALTYERTNLIMFPALTLTLSYIYSYIGLIFPKHYQLLITYLLPYLCLSALLENKHTRHSHEVDWQLICTLPKQQVKSDNSISGLQSICPDYQEGANSKLLSGFPDLYLWLNIKL